jgi:hypothetical protein
MIYLKKILRLNPMRWYWEKKRKKIYAQVKREILSASKPPDLSYQDFNKRHKNNINMSKEPDIKFYCPMWVKKLICYYFKHKIVAQYVVYETQKKRWRSRPKGAKTGGTLEEEKRYNPFLVYYCARCGKRFGEKRLKRMLNKEEAKKYTGLILHDITILNNLAKNK